MPWDDDFLDELQTATGLSPDQLVDVIFELPENAAELERRRRQEAIEQAERDKAEAKAKGRALLLSHLDDGQRATFEAGETFVVTGSAGSRYCVHLGRQHNIWSINEDNRHVRNYCIHVRDAVPDEDNVLAQTLLLESNEAEFLRVANVS